MGDQTAMLQALGGEAARFATVVVCAGEKQTLDLVCDQLASHRFEPLPARTAAEALRLCRDRRPDVLIVDPELPNGSGSALISWIRDGRGRQARIDPYLPVIALEPFAFDGLRARIDAALRSREDFLDEPITVRGLRVDPARREVRVDGREAPLSRKEFTLLRILASDPARVFTKDELMRDVWGFDGRGLRTRTLDSHASRLRRKLDPEHARYVVNCWGVGYRLIDD